MRKIFIAILLFAFISGCEKSFDDVVDVNRTSYQVTSLNSFNSFRYVEGDSVLTIFLYLSSSKDIAQVFCNVIASDDSKLNSDPVLLSDNGQNGDATAGDNKFTGLFPMSRFYPVGIYTINYFVTDNNGSTKQVALHQFTYDNGQANVAPVISNAFIDPDTIVVTDTTYIQTSIQVSDGNGLNDVESVYFIVYKPDGTTNNFKTVMLDDGNLDVNGDETAGDGIFSRVIQVNQSNDKGIYRFEFTAEDRGGLISNIINYSVLIQ
jgi:hypothetical protein